MAKVINFVTFAIAFAISLVNSIIVPVEYKRTLIRCNDRQKFKVVPECQFDQRLGLVVKVYVGPKESNERHSVILLVDTGSARTWVANNNTKVNSSAHNNIISWEQFTQEPPLFYNFQLKNNEGPSSHTYGDQTTVAAIEYSNQVLLLRGHQPNVNLVVNMSLSLAEYVHTKHDSDFASGILGLCFSTNPEGIFLHFGRESMFLKHYERGPGHVRMISFDLNWDHMSKMPLPSCFGIGQSVSAYNQQKSVLLPADPFHSWKIMVYSIKVEFANTGNSYTLHQRNGHLDVGANKLTLPKSFVNGFVHRIERQAFHYEELPCPTLLDMLPEILITFRDINGKKLEFYLGREQLYEPHPDDWDYCISSLWSFDYYSSVILGVPFFSSAYVEMHWDQRHNGKVMLSHKYHSFV